MGRARPVLRTLTAAGAAALCFLLPLGAGADAPHVGVSRITLSSGIAQTVSRQCGGPTAWTAT